MGAAVTDENYLLDYIGNGGKQGGAARIMYVIGAVAASAERCQDNPNAVFSSAVSIDCG